MPVRQLAKTLRNIIRSKRGVTIGDVTFRMPLGVCPKIEEPWMREVLNQALPASDGDFIDVGANLGQTLMSLRALDRARRYIGFEPNIDCVSAVRSIIKLNNLENSFLIPAACGLSFGVAKLNHYLNSKFDTSASLVPGYRASALRETLVVVAPAIQSLEALELQRVGLVKIDVEGFEADVLEALEPILSRDQPLLLVEVLPIRDDPKREISALRIQALLKRLGYSALGIRTDPSHSFAGFSERARPGYQSDATQSDFLFVPDGHFLHKGSFLS